MKLPLTQLAQSHNNLLKLLALVMLILTLQACGGSGSSSTPELETEPELEIEIEPEPEPETLDSTITSFSLDIQDDTYIGARAIATCEGTGPTFSFSSNNEVLSFEQTAPNAITFTVPQSETTLTCQSESDTEDLIISGRAVLTGDLVTVPSITDIFANAEVIVGSCHDSGNNFTDKTFYKVSGEALMLEGIKSACLLVENVTATNATNSEQTSLDLVIIQSLEEDDGTITALTMPLFFTGSGLVGSEYTIDDNQDERLFPITGTVKLNDVADAWSFETTGTDNILVGGQSNSGEFLLQASLNTNTTENFAFMTTRSGIEVSMSEIPRENISVLVGKEATEATDQKSVRDRWGLFKIEATEDVQEYRLAVKLASEPAPTIQEMNEDPHVSFYNLSSNAINVLLVTRMGGNMLAYFEEKQVKRDKMYKEKAKYDENHPYADIDIYTELLGQEETEEPRIIRPDNNEGLLFRNSMFEPGATHIIYGSLPNTTVVKKLLEFTTDPVNVNYYVSSDFILSSPFLMSPDNSITFNAKNYIIFPVQHMLNLSQSSSETVSPSGISIAPQLILFNYEGDFQGSINPKVDMAIIYPGSLDEYNDDGAMFITRGQYLITRHRSGGMLEIKLTHTPTPDPSYNITPNYQGYPPELIETFNDPKSDDD